MFYVVIKVKIFQLCRTRVVYVAFMSHSCRSCRTLAALLLLVSGTRVINLARSLKKARKCLRQKKGSEIKKYCME